MDKLIITVAPIKEDAEKRIKSNCSSGVTGILPTWKSGMSITLQIVLVSDPQGGMGLQMSQSVPWRNGIVTMKHLRKGRW